MRRPALIDPVWGGVFQYSEAGSWATPHFEKIISFQAQYLRQYSQAYALWRDPKYLAAARDIERYLASFLISPDGAFYVSQDADLDHDIDGHAYYALDEAGRRRLGVPRIDSNIYARENGWAISGLAAFYDVTNDPTMLALAERAAKWVDDNRRCRMEVFAMAKRTAADRFFATRWRWDRPSSISMSRPAIAIGWREPARPATSSA